jgi:DNA-binding response OmpR family regulator
VFIAADGIQAIERIAEYQPDLIILDAMLPKMSGYQLCQSLRRNARYVKTPILLMSAKASQKDQEYARRIGVDGFMAKPFDRDLLLSKVAELSRLPGFMVYPKSLTVEQIAILEKDRERERRKRIAEEKASRSQTELEDFLKQHR